MRDAAAYAIGYGAQVTAYALLVTDRYPDATPGRVEPPPSCRRTRSRSTLRDDLGRPRLLVAFRLLLVDPAPLLAHALGRARPRSRRVARRGCSRSSSGASRGSSTASSPRSSARRRTSSAFLYVVGRPFPGFVGREGSYPDRPDDRAAGPAAPARRARPARARASRRSSSRPPTAVLVRRRRPRLAHARSSRAGCPAGSATSASRRCATRRRSPAYLLLADVPVPDSSPVLVGRPEAPLPSRRRSRDPSPRRRRRRGRRRLGRLSAGSLAGTVVPDDLSLPRVDVDAVFGQRARRRAPSGTSASSTSTGSSPRSRCSPRSASTRATASATRASRRRGRSARGCCSGCSGSRSAG